jgi:hypothetical protein
MHTGIYLQTERKNLMNPSDHRPQGETKSYTNDPFKKLSIQDAMILITVWAATLDDDNLQKKTKCITGLDFEND